MTGARIYNTDFELTYKKSYKQRIKVNKAKL